MKDGHNTLADMYGSSGKKTDEFCHGILKFIINGNYALQYRSNLDSDNWENCSFKDLIKGILRHKWEEPYAGVFDVWSLNFYRIRPNIVVIPDKFMRITDKIEHAKEEQI